MRGALLGVGRVAVNGHIPGWKRRREIELAAAADCRDSSREAFLGLFPSARWYSDPEELLARERLDFVDICTPPDTHGRLIRASLERSCHVLCEKPLVVKAGDLGPLAALAATRDRTLVTVHNWLHAPALAKLSALLREGAIGRPRRCRWETLRTEPAGASGDSGNWRMDPARAGGGVLLDHGWHAVSAVNSWLGKPRTVWARLTTERHRDFAVEDTAILEIDYGSSSAEIRLTWAANERANRIEVEGDDGVLRLDGGTIRLETERAAARERGWDFPPLTEGSHHPDWFDGVIEDFLSEVADTSRRGKNLDEAALCVTVLSLAQQSSHRNEVLPVPDLGR
ncbi:MAG TPA: Gfo/Idh/MocA family oxidoreductase [Thermoanaerobaculia bacterium]